MSKKITKEARDLFLAMVLGDGHLDKYGQLNLLHSDKQLEYLEWKRNALIKSGIKVSEIKEKINNKRYKAYYCSTGVYDFTKLYRKVLYQPKKQFSIKTLNKLNSLHLAIWYMDDGSLTSLKNKDGYWRGSLLRISTHLEKEENQVIIDYFKSRWGVRFNQRKHSGSYILECATKEARKFISIVYKYVYRIPCMRYKLNIKPLTCRDKRLEKGATLKESNDIV